VARNVDAGRDDAAVLRVGHQDRLCGMTGRGWSSPTGWIRPVRPPP